MKHIDEELEQLATLTNQNNVLYIRTKIQTNTYHLKKETQYYVNHGLQDTENTNKTKPTDENVLEINEKSTQTVESNMAFIERHKNVQFDQKKRNRVTYTNEHTIMVQKNQNNGNEHQNVQEPSLRLAQKRSQNVDDILGPKRKAENEYEISVHENRKDENEHRINLQKRQENGPEIMAQKRKRNNDETREEKKFEANSQVMQNDHTNSQQENHSEQHTNSGYEANNQLQTRYKSETIKKNMNLLSSNIFKINEPEYNIQFANRVKLKSNISKRTGQNMSKFDIFLNQVQSHENVKYNILLFDKMADSRNTSNSNTKPNKSAENNGHDLVDTTKDQTNRNFHESSTTFNNNIIVHDDQTSIDNTKEHAINKHHMDYIVNQSNKTTYTSRSSMTRTTIDHKLVDRMDSNKHITKKSKKNETESLNDHKFKLKDHKKIDEEYMNKLYQNYVNFIINQTDNPTYNVTSSHKSEQNSLHSHDTIDHFNSTKTLCASNEQITQNQTDTAYVKKAYPRTLLNSFKILFTNNEIQEPLKMVLMLMLITTIASLSPIRPFLFDILNNHYDGVNTDQVLIGTSVINIVGSFLCSLTINRLGKRKLALLGLISCSIINFTLSYYTNEHVHSSIVPIVCIYMNSFLQGYGILQLPWVFMSEIFSLEIRGIGCGICAGFSYLLNFVLTKTYLNMTNMFGLEYTLYCYSVCGTLGILYVYWYMPETENKTLQEIQNQFIK